MEKPPDSVKILSPARAVAFDTIGSFVLVTAGVALLYRLHSIPFVERNLAVIAAILFLYVPAVALWRRGRDLEHYGLRSRPLGKSLGVYALAVAIVLPLFSIGYYLWVRRICPHLPHNLLRCPPVAIPSLRLPTSLPMAILSQLLVVALPEEFFFRGFIQGRLREVLSLPASLVLTAVLFALGHYFVTFDPAGLAVFFPGLLFGLLRAKTGSVLAGTLFHATCNLLIDTLHRSFG